MVTLEMLVNWMMKAIYLTGRKKEIYVSSAGKNIAPLVIEETMKSIPIVSQCFQLR